MGRPHVPSHHTHKHTQAQTKPPFFDKVGKLHTMAIVLSRDTAEGAHTREGVTET